MAVYYVYLLLCADGSYYCGSTNDPEKRLQAHNAGRGAKYTRGRGPCTIAYLEEFDDDTTGDVHFVYFTAAQAARQPA